MKRFSIVAALMTLFVAACGGGEQPVAEEPAAVQPEVEALVEMPTLADELQADEAAPQIVEESAAEEEDRERREREGNEAAA